VHKTAPAFNGLGEKLSLHAMARPILLCRALMVSPTSRDSNLFPLQVVIENHRAVGRLFLMAGRFSGNRPQVIPLVQSHNIA